MIVFLYLCGQNRGLDKKNQPMHKKYSVVKSLALIGFICILNSNLSAQNDTISDFAQDFSFFADEFMLNDELVITGEFIITGGRPVGNYYSAIYIQFFGGNFMNADFSEFQRFLGVENVDSLNRGIPTFNIGFGYFYRGFNAMFQFGIPIRSGDRSSNIRTSTRTFGLQFGYRILDVRICRAPSITQTFFIRPDVALKYHRIRLTNQENQTVHLGNYVRNRDLDIRFHQLTGYGGITIAFEFARALLLTVSGGYHWRLNTYPWITSSAGSRIITNDRINVGYGINVGLSLLIPTRWL